MVKKKDNHFSAGKSRAKDSRRLKVSCLFMAILALALGGLLSLGVLCRLDAKRREPPHRLQIQSLDDGRNEVINPGLPPIGINGETRHLICDRQPEKFSAIGRMRPTYLAVARWREFDNRVAVEGKPSLADSMLIPPRRLNTDPAVLRIFRPQGCLPVTWSRIGGYNEQRQDAKE